MSVQTVTCPHCSASLKTNQEGLLGKKIKCLKCGSRFRVTEDGQQSSNPCGDTHNEVLGLNDTLAGSPKAPVPIAAPYLPPEANLFKQPSRSSNNHALQLGLVCVALVLVLTTTALGLIIYCLSVGGARTSAVAAPVPHKVLNPSAESVNLKLPTTPVQATPKPVSAPAPTPTEPPPPAPEVPAPAPKAPPVAAPGPAPEAPPPAAPAPPPPAPPAEIPAPPAKPAPAPVAAVVNFAQRLPAAQQARVDAAIDRGVKHLRLHQQANGVWDVMGQARVYPVAYAALPGLTMLECGIPATDPAVQRAAAFVRFNAAQLNRTYELSLAILFLDRLGEPNDRKLIQTLALRLVAGQSVHGGWTYVCPILSQPEDHQLLSFLKLNRPIPAVEPIGPEGLPQIELIRKEQPEPSLNPISPGQQGPTSEPLQKSSGGRADALQYPEASGQPGLIPPAQPGDLKALIPGNTLPSKDKAKATPKQPARPTQKAAKQPKTTPKQLALPPALQPNLQHLALLQKQGRGRFGAVRDDNSNTQFAILALWAARRHDVPMDTTLALVNYRFRTSQYGDGSWGYHYAPGASKPSMTCVGLLGLGLGHGSFKEAVAAAGMVPVAAKGKGNPGLQDPFIQKGLRNLGLYVGVPTGRQKNVPMTNLYYLWSLERVAVMYDLKTIGGKDWYGWAAELLVANQWPDGSWQTHSYHGSAQTVDTCLALLILKRANLTRDLSDSLRTYIALPDRNLSGQK